MREAMLTYLTRRTASERPLPYRCVPCIEPSPTLTRVMRASKRLMEVIRRWMEVRDDTHFGDGLASLGHSVW